MPQYTSLYICTSKSDRIWTKINGLLKITITSSRPSICLFDPNTARVIKEVFPKSFVKTKYQFLLSYNRTFDFFFSNKAARGTMSHMMYIHTHTYMYIFIPSTTFVLNTRFASIVLLFGSLSALLF